METEQIALNREASLSQMGDDYLSLRRQSRQLASHWHDLSILFQGYPTTTTRRQSLKDWLSRAEVVLSELLRWMGKCHRRH
jgi:phosphatidylserine/phosphatidylglycerophosphate/cardiolipin synthase-like enzyme